MVENQKLVKISDLVDNQIPEFVLDENPNFSEFLKTYYQSQEYQGGVVDLAENLTDYKNFSAFNSTNLIVSTSLIEDVDIFSDVIYVQSTNGWPQAYGLLKIDNEIITYTGITTNSFTGCVRGFSGADSLSEEDGEFLVFTETESDFHTSGSTVHNLSNLFLIEFFKKQKQLYAPGFEDVDFDSQVNPQNFLSKSRTFYQSKGTDEAYKILFKVLYDESVQVIKPREYCFTPSDDKWVVTETFICELIEGNPFELEGQTLYQDQDPFNSNVLPANGSIYAVDSFLSGSNTYYKIRIFSGYSNNLNPKGSISGKFLPTFSTYCVEDVSVGSNSIIVDSTVGFPKSGLLYIGENVYTYSDKTNNQFLNVSSQNDTLITFAVNRGDRIFATNYVYSYANGDLNNRVELRINNVVSNISTSNSLYSLKDDPIKIDNIGYTDNNTFVKSLKYNLPISIYAGKAVETIDAGVRSAFGQGFAISNGLVLTKYDHNLKNGDLVDLYVKKLGRYELYLTNIQVITSLSKEFSIQKIDDTTILGKDILFRRKLKKTKAVPFTPLYNEINNVYTANVQDSYADDSNNYLTSNGLPDYEVNPYIREFKFSASETNDRSLIGSHNFYDGESVKVVGYAVSGNFTNTVGFNTGDTYFVKRIGPTKIRLSETRATIGITSISLIELNINNNIEGKLEDITLVSSPLYGNEFSSTKSLRKLPKTPFFEKSKIKTQSGPVGVFVNGVEIQSYKSFDKIYYGKLEEINVLSGGEGYSLTNPPRFEIFNNETDRDNQTFIIPEMEGSLVGLKILNPGYDYESTPTVTVTGGNRKDIPTQVKMKYIDKVVRFNSTTKGTVVRTVDNYFDFGYGNVHPFIETEPVVYETLGTFPIGIGTQPEDGTLLDQGVYYVCDVGAATSFKLAPTKIDAVNKTNLINLRTTGGGLQRFRSLEQVQIIDDVSFVGIQSGFSNKKLSFGPEHINIFDNIFYFDGHGYNNGEEVVITAEGTFLGGAVDGQIYYIDKLDDNSFRLCTDFERTNILNIVSTDFATTYFVQYPPIEGRVEGKIKTTTSAVTGYGATIVPIVDGYVKSAKVQRGLSKPALTLLGAKDTINYHKRPTILVTEGIDAEFQPVIENGSIVDVIVKNPGENYFNDFDFIIAGQGYGARLSAIISNGDIFNGSVSYGEIMDVIVLDGGIGYASTDTTVRIQNKGSGLRIQGNLTTWTLNEVEKLGVSNLSNGCLFGVKYSKFGNTFGTFFLDQNLITSFGIDSTKHSPIVGWAYDGSPIYGPYAYENTDGSGTIVRMRSGYSKTKVSPTTFLECVEDYQFTNTGTLDENNGRFAVTPEYPRGVYAYYCTIDENNTPVFPYVIGDTYNYIPDPLNFDLDFNQDQNFNDLGIIKYTKPYRVDDKENYYEYFDLTTNSEKPDAVVTSTSTGKINSIKVIDGGTGYEVGDKIIFESEKSGDPGAFGQVVSVAGVGVTQVISGISTLSNVSFTTNKTGVVGIATTAHNFKSQTYVNITGLSSYFELEGFRKISVEQKSTVLLESLDSASVTGLVTSIRVKEPVLSFRVDEELLIGSETLKVIGLDRINSRLNVLRQSGSPSYGIGYTVTEVSSRFTFAKPTNFNSNLNELNETYYFKPSQSVSVGISTVAGVGNILTVYPYGIGVSQTKFVEHGGIYLPQHNFVDGEKVVYSTDSSTIVTNAGNLDSLPNLFIVKLDQDVIGLVEDKRNVKNRDSLLRYNAAGTGNLHKFTTQRSSVVTGTATQVNVNVSAASSHGLSIDNNVKLSIVSGVTTTYTVGYSSITKRVLIDGQVNPRVRTYANEKVVFDLTDSSISGKDFNLYSDSFFRNPYFGNEISGIEVIKTATELTLTITKNTPSLLYYNITNITTNDQIFPDFTVSGNNELKLENSLYSIESKITGVTSTTFEYNLATFPERSEYTNSLSSLNYLTLDSGIKGPISEVKLSYPGSSYESVPSVSKIVTNSGKGADLYATTSEIGRVKSVKILNKESIYPSDKTLSPVSNTVSALRLKDGYFVSDVEILDAGKKYSYPPTIKLYNPTDDVVDSAFSATVIQNSNTITDVVISNPSTKLKSTFDTIVATNNSNGIRILNATSSGSFPYEVELTLETPISGFSTSNPLPISVGDEIFVENISSSAGSGYNSSNHGYRTFTVTFVNPNFSAPDAATIRYELDTYPGVFSSLTFNASVSKYSDLAKFRPILSRGQYLNGEVLSPYQVEIIDNEKNEPITDLIKVHNPSTLIVGDVISGNSSKNTSEIFEITNFKSSISLDSSVSEEIGWKDFRGNLSTILQKLQDNDYYQNFSYSLKSRKSLSEWKSIVSDISHVSGYKQFSDLNIESNLPVSIASTLTVRSDSTSSVSISLVNEADVTSISNYDLAIEEDIDDSEGTYSEFIKFGTKKLSDFLLSEANRVLSVDDISSLFDTDNSPFVLVPIDTVDTTDNIVLKYFFFIGGTTSFFGDFEKPQVFDLFLTRNDDKINLTSYAYFYDFYTSTGLVNFPLGEIQATISPTNGDEITINFSPRNIFNSYAITAIRETAPVVAGITSSSYGYVDAIEKTTEYAGIGSSYTLYSYPLADLESGVGVIGISSASRKVESAYEFTFIKNTDNTIDVNVFSEQKTKELGTFGISTTVSGEVIFGFDDVIGIGVTVFANLQIIKNSPESTYNVVNDLTVVTSENYDYTGSSPVGLTTVPQLFAATKHIIQVEKTVGVSTERSLFQINSVHFGDYNNLTTYGFVGNMSSDEFSFDNIYDPGLGQYTLTLTPTVSADYNFKLIKKTILSPNI